MRKVLLVILFFINISSVFGQRDVTPPIEVSRTNVSTPEVSQLIKYDEFPNLDFIGKSDISIPLYSIKFGSLTIPIALSYNVKGNKVADIAPNTGLGWSLIANGVITLKINDIDDFEDSYSYYANSSYEPEQSTAWHRSVKGYQTVVNDDTTSDGEIYLGSRMWDADDYLIDAAPDFYNISAPGFTDKFYLTGILNHDIMQDGISVKDVPFKAKFFNNYGAKLLQDKLDFTINPNYVTYQSVIGNSGSSFGSMGSGQIDYCIKEFKIANQNGYIYDFADPQERSQKTIPYGLYEPGQYSLHSNSWLLSSIKDPISNNTLTYIYENYENNYENLDLYSNSGIDLGSYPVKGLENGSFPTDRGSKEWNSINKTSFPNSKRLKTIKFDEGEVDFIYNLDRIDYPGQALTKIEVKNLGGRVIKTINLNYDYFGTGNNCSDNYQCKRLKLLSIDDSSSGSYNFTYGNSKISNTFPQRNSSKTDFLGYFNNNSSDITFSETDFHPYERFYPDSKIYFYPDLTKDQLLPFALTNRTANTVSGTIDRSPNSQSQIGLLTTIKYPTGGLLKIDYENDDFLYEGQKYILGSSRVKSINLTADGDQNKEIHYNYVNEDGTSSGQINFFTPPSKLKNTVISTGIGFGNGAVIGYSRIVEETTGKGKVEKLFSNFSDYPDQIMTISEPNLTQPIKNFIKFFKFPLSYVQTYDNRRGQLKQSSAFAEGNSSPLKTDTYQYDFKVRDVLNLNKIVSAYDDPNLPYRVYSFNANNTLSIYSNNLLKQTNQNSFTNGSIITENNFDYDSTYNFLRLKTSKDLGTLKEESEKYTYPNDISLQKLIDANILNLPIKIETFKDNKKISRLIKEFTDPATVNETAEINYGIEDRTIGGNVTFDQYDSKSNLLQFTTNNGTPTTIIWGYNQTKPIAKIIGASYPRAVGSNKPDPGNEIPNNLIKNIVDASNAIPYSESSLLTALDAFRTDPLLSKYQISTFSWIPLVGVSNITPPSGIRQNYTYDTTTNKLQSVKDVNGNILKEYKYNYASEVYYNSLKSQIFTRNNCDASAIGGTYTYTVPPNQYTSILSQADADQKAQNDININGPSAANVNGTCSPISCSLSFYFSGGGGVTVDNNINYKIRLGFSTGSNSTNQPWSTGVTVAAINGTCRPNSDYSGYNGQIYYTVKTNGDIIIRSGNGNYPNNTNLGPFDLFVPIN